MRSDLSLDELCEFIVDCPHKTAPESSDAFAYAVGTKAVDNGRIYFENARPVDQGTYRTWIARATPRENDLILCREAPVGPVARVPAYPLVCLGQRTVLLRADYEVIEPDYLMYALLAPGTQSALRTQSEGSTVPHLNVADIRTFFIEVPPRAEQRHVAKTLGCLDDKIDSNRRLIEILGELSRRWFAQLDGATTETTALGDLVEVVDCLHSKKPKEQDEGGLLLQLNNIRDDGLMDLSSKFQISEADYANWIRRIELTEEDCLITNVGRVGAVARVPRIRAALGRNMTGLRCRIAWPFPSVLIEALRSPRMRRAIDELTDAGTVMNALNVRNIPKLPLPALEREMLVTTEAILSPIWRFREALLRESTTLAAMRDLLLPRLISGEISLPLAENREEVTGPVGEQVVA